MTERGKRPVWATCMNDEPATTIFFNGEPTAAHPGDTVASALYRAGQRIFSRSFKYHRPRGLLCGAGRCPNCLVNVDGTPNVRACTEPVRAGMQVRHQNAFPSLERDWLAVAERFDWLMPVGFYYKTFTHPTAWRFVEPLIRRVAGLGEVADQAPAASDDAPGYEHLYIHTDVVVVGGGPAGIAAAIAAAQQGRRVTLVDDQPGLGGHLRYTGRGANGDAAAETVRELTTRLAALPNMQVLTSATCLGLYEGHLLGIVQQDRVRQSHVRERLVQLRAAEIVVATGAYETPLIFENNDLPSVMLSSAVLRLANMHGIKPGEQAVVVGDEARAAPVVACLQEAGTRLAAVVPSAEVIAARGTKQVTGITTTAQANIPCDLIVVCGDRVPDAGLVMQAGGTVAWDEQRAAFVVETLPDHVTAVGDVTGDGVDVTGLHNPLGIGGADLASSAPASALAGRGAGRPKRSFVCLCEDVTTKDIDAAIAEGFDHIETLKRYTTVTMGPCQGKMCQLASIGVCAQRTGRTIGQTGRTTSRPPTAPVSLGALAGARHHPVKRTPMHHKHDELGCVWMDMGDWQRPLYYGAADAKQQAVEEEYWAVRKRVGVIDLSTLGKLEVRGADAPKLLDKVYTNRLSDLRVGGSRYSVICDDAGIILDDGTISRLAADRFFITTTTGNIEFVQQWLEWWLVATDWRVHITNVTGGLAAVNVAGPRARDTLAKLTERNLGRRAFRYMRCRRAEVAGVPSIMLRIGFVGETGWELHFPAEYGEYLWDAILDAGKEFDIRPFGVETQRVLRLEKRHLIVGVDTDATSNVLEADMAWVAKLDKEDFIGKAATLQAQERAPREQLVGFEMRDDVVPEDGAALVLDGRPVGRVTSARYSPVNGKAVGLAWVSHDLATAGRTLTMPVRGRLARAQIVADPFYDPAGKQLRA